jgi:hypothetical protein
LPAAAPDISKLLKLSVPVPPLLMLVLAVTAVLAVVLKLSVVLPMLNAGTAAAVPLPVRLTATAGLLALLLIVTLPLRAPSAPGVKVM